MSLSDEYYMDMRSLKERVRILEQKYGSSKVTVLDTKKFISVGAIGADDQYVKIADIEDTPTENEADKVVSSEYIFDHDADISAHHVKTVKYTDEEVDAIVATHDAIVDAHHTATVAGDLNHNALANLDADDIKHITNAQLGALHTVIGAGDLSHDSLANIDAGDVKHITNAQLGALHTVIGAGDLSHNSLAGLNDGTSYEHITQTQKTALHAEVTDLDHDGLTNFEADEHIDWTVDQSGVPKLIHANNYVDEVGEGGGVTDHGALDGLNDDDHSVIYYNKTAVDGAFTTHIAIDDAHHTKYLDSEVDAIVLTHKNIATAHHTATVAGDLAHNSLTGLNDGTSYEHITQNQKTALHAKYLDAEAVTSMGVKGDGNPLNHDKPLDWLGLDGIGSYTHYLPTFGQGLPGTNVITTTAGMIATATGLTWFYLDACPPPWLMRYCVANSKTLTQTSIDVVWDNYDSSSYITQTIIYHHDRSRGYNAKNVTKMNDTTNYGSGSSGVERTDNFNHTNFSLAIGDTCIVRVYANNPSNPQGVRWYSVKIYYTIS